MSQPPAYGAPHAPPVPGYAIGTVRGTGFAMLMFIITFGIYGLYWYFVTHEEMKRHTGTGIGGGIGLLIAFFVGIASPFISSSEVGSLYQRAGRPAPVSGATGLWVFPGIFLVFLPIVWFVKTNGALNDYWKAHGAVG
jgi:hypothetical protein